MLIYTIGYLPCHSEMIGTLKKITIEKRSETSEHVTPEIDVEKINERRRKTTYVWNSQILLDDIF